MVTLVHHKYHVHYVSLFCFQIHIKDVMLQISVTFLKTISRYRKHMKIVSRIDKQVA